MTLGYTIILALFSAFVVLPSFGWIIRWIVYDFYTNQKQTNYWEFLAIGFFTVVVIFMGIGVYFAFQNLVMATN